ncbi:MAG: DUF4124 domain-containing protein [Nitrospinaceae bacterium]
MAALAGIFCLLQPGPGEGGVFKWRDKNGTTHYTDNLNQVPRAFRRSGEIKKMRSFDPAPRRPVKKSPPPEKPGVTGAEVEAPSSLDAQETAATNGDLKEEGGSDPQQSASIEKAPPAPAPLAPPKLKKRQWQVIRDYSTALGDLMKDFESVLDSSKKYELDAKWFFESAQRFQKIKEDMVQNFYSARLDVLKPTARFFLKTQVYDFSLEEGGSEAPARLELLKVRMQEEIDRAKELKPALDALLSQAPSP